MIDDVVRLSRTDREVDTSILARDCQDPNTGTAVYRDQWTKKLDAFHASRGFSGDGDAGLRHGF